ncbi:MAG: hypothetical protein KatS3mg081_1431 [Gemmatimonadales bacterium]|nr:MAG: hypothetical protein KatS3mg081_1431 [Gemmatimonadales bacterium]
MIDTPVLNSRAAAAGALAAAILLQAAAYGPDSPVADAAQRGDLETVRALLQEGADVNAPQNDGMTALHWAALQGNVPMVRLLIYAGANLEATTRLGGYTPLHLASQKGAAEALRVLLEAGSNVHAVTTTGAQAIHFAALAGNPDALKVLLSHGADPNAKESYADRTPLMFAAAYNRVAAIQVLLAAGADLSAATRVVDYAARAKEDDALRRQRERLMAARYEGSRQSARERRTPPPPQVPPQPPDEPDRPTEPRPDSQARRPAAPEPLSYEDWVGKQGGMAALHYAAREGRLEAVRLLLDAGADIDQVTLGDHSTPLLVAIINGHYDLAMYLLSRGADPNIASEDGVAPLFAAINCEWSLRTWYPQPTAYQQQKTTYLELMEALLKAGADPNARLKTHLWYAAYNAGRMGVDYSGATAFWRAAYALDVAAMRLLVKYGADPNIPTIKPAERRRPGEDPDSAETDPSGLPPVPVGGPAVYPIHAASGVGYGTSRVGQQHRYVPDGWLPAVKYLVEELGADVNARDHEGYTPLHNAAARGDNEMILYLVSKGADVMAVSRRGQTTVDMANGPQQRVQPFPETIALLESLGAKNNHRCMSCE